MSISWPGHAKIAVSLAFDLDSNTIWRNKIRDLPNGAGYLKGPSVGEFGPKVAADRILDILDEFQLKATWFVPATVVEENPALIRRFLDAGHELSHHGFDHTSDYGATFEAQRAYIERSQAVFEKHAGVRAVGCRNTGPLLPETERWMYTEGGFLYHTPGCSSDLLEYYEVDGVRTNAVNIPCPDELDDYIMSVFNSYPQVLVGLPAVACYDGIYKKFIRETEGAVRYGQSISTSFHPQVCGRGGRALLLRDYCQYLAEHPDIWCAPCADVARYYKSVKEG